MVLLVPILSENSLKRNKTKKEKIIGLWCFLIYDTECSIELT